MLRRVFLVVLSILTVCGCVLSCSKGDDVDIYSFIYELCEAGGSDAHETAVFYADERSANENSGLRVRSNEEFGFLYDGVFAEPACFGRIEGFVIRMPQDDSGFEVHVIKCVNVSDTSEVAAMLQRRVDRLQSAEILEFAPESYEICFRGAIVYTRGRLAFLISTYDNEAVRRVIDKQI